MQAAAIGGFPMPPLPIHTVPSVEELKFIRMEMSAAAEAFRQMCICTIEIADKISVPEGIPEDDVTEEAAHRIFNGHVASRSLHVLRKSILLSMFYAALIMSIIQPATALFVDSQPHVVGHILQPLYITSEYHEVAQQMICKEVSPTDSCIGSDHIPRTLCSPWMPQLMQTTQNLDLLPCTVEALSQSSKWVA